MFSTKQFMSSVAHGAEYFRANSLDVDEDSGEFADDIAWQPFQAVMTSIAAAYEEADAFSKSSLSPPDGRPHVAPNPMTEAWIPMSILMEVDSCCSSGNRANPWSDLS